MMRARAATTIHVPKDRAVEPPKRSACLKNAANLNRIKIPRGNHILDAAKPKVVRRAPRRLRQRSDLSIPRTNANGRDLRLCYLGAVCRCDDVRSVVASVTRAGSNRGHTENPPDRGRRERRNFGLLPSL